MTDNEATTDASPTPRRWHTSSYTQERGECVEVAEGPVTGVRDSKNRDHGALFFGAAEWGAFLASVRNREL